MERWENIVLGEANFIEWAVLRYREGRVEHSRVEVFIYIYRWGPNIHLIERTNDLITTNTI